MFKTTDINIVEMCQRSFSFNLQKRPKKILDNVPVIR